MTDFPAAAQYLVEPLTRRELEILALIADHRSNSEIAKSLNLALSSVKWYARQIYAKLGVNSRRQAVERAVQLGLLGSDPIEQPQSIRIPNPLTPLVGREADIHQLTGLLEDPEVRLITLLGPGGIGKTRLAIQVASDLARSSSNQFTDGIYYVELASVLDSRGIVPSIWSSLNFTFSGNLAATLEQLIQFLLKKKALFVLDNCEHLVDEGTKTILREILSAAGDVQILLTSRVRMMLHGEQVYQVSGLSFPTEREMLSWEGVAGEARKYSALELFERSANRGSRKFDLSQENAYPVTEICRLLEGVPLAIELAASWLSVMEPAEIAAGIQESLDFLEAEADELHKRQSSLRAVFDGSWKFLSSDERAAVECLAIFQYGFDWTLASEACQVSRKTLLGLVNKSWVAQKTPGWFSMHELLRQYARRVSGVPRSQEPEIVARAAQYYCRFLVEREPLLKGAGQTRAITQIGEHIENIKQAWPWMLERETYEHLQAALFSLCSYFVWRGRLDEGLEACQLAYEACRRRAQLVHEIDPHIICLTGLVLIWQSLFFVSDFEREKQLLDQCRALFNDPKLIHLTNARERAFLEYALSLHTLHEDRQQAQRHLEESLKLYQMLGDDWGISRVFHQIGGLYWTVGSFKEARRYLDESLAIQTQTGDMIGAAISMNSLGLVLKHLGQFEEAERLQRESLHLELTVGNPFEAAATLGNLAITLAWQGKYAEAQSLAYDCVATYKDLGIFESSGAHACVAINTTSIHLGDYEIAKQYALKGMQIARRRSWRQEEGILHQFLGMLYGVDRDYETSKWFLRAAFSIFNRINQNIKMLPMIFLSYILLQEEKYDEAYESLVGGIRLGVESHSMYPVLCALPAVCVLLSSMSRNDLALDYYQHFLRYPHLTQSRWFHDITGDRLALLNDQIKRMGDHRPANLSHELDLWKIADLFLATEMR